MLCFLGTCVREPLRVEEGGAPSGGGTAAATSAGCRRCYHGQLAAPDPLQTRRPSRRRKEAGSNTSLRGDLVSRPACAALLPCCLRGVRCCCCRLSRPAARVPRSRPRASRLSSRRAVSWSQLARVPCALPLLSLSRCLAVRLLHDLAGAVRPVPRPAARLASGARGLRRSRKSPEVVVDRLLRRRRRRAGGETPTRAREA